MPVCRVSIREVSQTCCGLSTAIKEKRRGMTPRRFSGVGSGENSDPQDSYMLTDGI
jgi:hypothetical protein